MDKFIKLTEANSRKNSEILILNCRYIRSIKRGDKGLDTMIFMEDSKFFFVKELVEDIWEMIELVKAIPTGYRIPLNGA